MLNKKKIGVMLTSLLILSQCTIPAFAGTWHQTTNYEDKPVWEYIKDDGSYFTHDWLKDNNKWYFFGHGEMYQGEILKAECLNRGDNHHYYLCSDGHMADGGFYDVDKYSGHMVFTDNNGYIINGFFMVDGVLYCGNMDGVINKTWKGSSSSTYTDETDETSARLFYYKDGGKVLDEDGKPLASNNKFYSDIKYLPKYDSKGNLIGEIRN